MKREFDTIQLIKRETDWKKDSTNSKYTAQHENSSIFAYFSPAVYKMLIFTKGRSFKIDDDHIIYDELSVTEKSI